jgi:lipopolysaccharide transport protein LptA
MKPVLIIGALLALADPVLAAEPAKAPPAHQPIDKSPKKAPAAKQVDIKISGDKFDAVEGGKQFAWSGHVLIVREAMRVNCDSFIGEGTDPSHLRKITCTGHVHMQEPAVPDKHPEREGWSDKAVFENDIGLLTMTGSPRFREGDNRMKGDKVLYDTNLDRVHAEGNVAMDVIPPADHDPLAKPKEQKK